MKTKENILKDHAAVPKPQVESVHRAMQEFADQEKQALKEQLIAKIKNGYTHNPAFGQWLIAFLFPVNAETLK